MSDTSVKNCIVYYTKNARPVQVIEKIYNGIDTERFNPSADKNLRSALGVSKAIALLTSMRLESVYDHRFF
jgi:hypothetical protein